MTSFVSFGESGGFVWLILLLTLVLVVATAACAARRVRQMTAVAMLLAGALPLGVGVIGMLSAHVHGLAVIETLKAPTPADLSGSVSQSTACLLAGALGTLVACSIGVAALLRSTPEEPSVAPPGDVVTDDD